MSTVLSYIVVGGITAAVARVIIANGIESFTIGALGLTFTFTLNPPPAAAAAVRGDKGNVVGIAKLSTSRSLTLAEKNQVLKIFKEKVTEVVHASYPNATVDIDTSSSRALELKYNGSADDESPVARAVQTYPETATTASLLTQRRNSAVKLLRALQMQKLQEDIDHHNAIIAAVTDATSTTYTIRIINYSSEQHMFVFSEPPVTGTKDTIYTNSLAEKLIPTSSDESTNPFVWRTTVQYYAVVQPRGIADIPPPGRSSGIIGSSYCPISLYQKGAPDHTWASMVYHPKPQDYVTLTLQDKDETNGKNNAFRIDTSGGYVNTPNKGNTRYFNIGLGFKDSDTGKVILSGWVNAEPNKNYYFSPVTKFYVAVGEYIPGSVVDVNSYAKTRAEVDFTHSDFTTCEVTYTEQGNWETNFVES